MEWNKAEKGDKKNAVCVCKKGCILKHSGQGRPIQMIFRKKPKGDKIYETIQGKRIF